MRKRLIATVVACGSLMLVGAAPANAQSIGTLDPTCQNDGEAIIPLDVNLGPLARVRLRLLCVE